MTDSQFDFGMIGLGTMGRALLLNMASKGNAVAGYDTNADKAHTLVTEGGAPVHGFTDLAEFVASIRPPRPIMVLVPAGKPVDDVLAGLSQFLAPGDFVIDGGNSHFTDTNRRLATMQGKAFGFMGMGVSGGERGARLGPSMMPGGTPEQYARVQPVLESIAAQLDGVPCVALMGAGSAGHYVKMVHNGIEYAVMQILAETFDLLTRGLDLSIPQTAELFAEWAESEVGGYLVEITATVLNARDGDHWLVNLISDKAKGKGTGKWTSQDAFDLGLPIPNIDAAVSAREISGLKDIRVHIGEGATTSRLEASSADIKGAFAAASLISYVQGLAQIAEASHEYAYGTDLRQVTRVWGAGCIIRSQLLAPIRASLQTSPISPNILLDPQFRQIFLAYEPPLRRVVAAAAIAGVPVPVLSASLAYWDGLRSPRLPANLIQGQRDLFGAHTYERIDRPGAFHTDWEAAAR